LSLATEVLAKQRIVFLYVNRKALHERHISDIFGDVRHITE